MNRMSLRVIGALLLAAVAVPSTAQNAAPAAPAQVKPSKQAVKAIMDLQAAANGADVALIKAKVAEAQAVAATKEDRYLIGQLQLAAGLKTNDMTLGSSGLDAIAASGYLDSGKVAQLYSSLGVKAYNAKQITQAEHMFARAIALDARNVEAHSFLGEARLAQGQKAQAVAAFQQAIQASGAKPTEALLKRALGAAYEARLPVAAEIGRQWITLYPGAESWRTGLAIYRNTAKPDAETTLDVLRLMRATGALTTPTDFALYASVLTDQSNFIEAQTALDQAVAAKQLDSANAQIAGIAGTLQARPRTTAAELDAAAKSAQSGMALLRIGDRFYGLGQYAKAAELYRQAQAKGVDANLANLRIGVALTGAGDKAGATTAFNDVTGARADLARFWLLHLQSRA